jgi:polyhydroxyalkanoic acid synthase PhaR subunit
MTKTEEPTQDTDAFGVWRQLYDANEKAWTTALEQAMGTSEFGESSGRLLETMLAAQKSVRDNMRAYLETMNVPTREDIARLGELVIGLEEKSDQIADRLDDLDDVLRSQSAGAGKIDAIDRALRSQATQVAKIDKIAKRLDRIDRALRSQATQVAKIDKIAKRLDTIDRAVRSRAVDAGKPAGRAARNAAIKPAAAKRTTAAAKPAAAAAKPAAAAASARPAAAVGAADKPPASGRSVVE